MSTAGLPSSVHSRKRGSAPGGMPAASMVRHQATVAKKLSRDASNSAAQSAGSASKSGTERVVDTADPFVQREVAVQHRRGARHERVEGEARGGVEAQRRRRGGNA